MGVETVETVDSKIHLKEIEQLQRRAKSIRSL